MQIELEPSQLTANKLTANIRVSWWSVVDLLLVSVSIHRNRTVVKVYRAL